MKRHFNARFFSRRHNGFYEIFVVFPHLLACNYKRLFFGVRYVKPAFKHIIQKKKCSFKQGYKKSYPHGGQFSFSTEYMRRLIFFEKSVIMRI